MLKRKLTRKGEKPKEKDYKCEKRKIEEEQFKDLQVIIKLDSDEQNKGD